MSNACGTGSVNYSLVYDPFEGKKVIQGCNKEGKCSNVVVPRASQEIVGFSAGKGGALTYTVSTGAAKALITYVERFCAFGTRIFVPDSKSR